MPATAVTVCITLIALANAQASVQSIVPVLRFQEECQVPGR